LIDFFAEFAFREWHHDEKQIADDGYKSFTLQSTQEIN
jgi:hypothetical protein